MSTRRDWLPFAGAPAFVLVELSPDSGIGLFEFVDLQHELAELLGREVDLHTPASLSHFFREDVVDSAEVAYAA
jgi:hypothetical protein